MTCPKPYKFNGFGAIHGKLLGAVPFRGARGLPGCRVHPGAGVVTVSRVPPNKPYKFIGFGDIHGPKSYKFIRSGDIHGFIGLGAIHGELLGAVPFRGARGLPGCRVHPGAGVVTVSRVPAQKPYKFIGIGDIHCPKPYKFIKSGDIHGPKPYKFIKVW